MNEYFPGFEPDQNVRDNLLFLSGVVDLRQFDKVIISLSGGKDSHAMLFVVKQLADLQGADSSRLIAVYADTGMEWHNAEQHVRKLCVAAGIELKIVYPVRPMIEKFKFRFANIGADKTSGGFPSPACRYCTSHQKIQPIDRHINTFHGKILKVTGERWRESVSRSKLAEFVKIDRMQTKNRTVYGWRPMLAWTTNDVFAKIKETGVERHIAYDMGCDRLGCAGCIFSNDRDLKIEMRENPIIFEQLDRLEIETGFTMSMTRIKIRDRIKNA